MQIIKSLAVAFSLYSAIPMPHFEWKEEDMRYSGCFFPLVGLVIGGVIYGWWYFATIYSIPQIALILIAAAVPIIITGGFHIDGYMDVCDSIKSYGSIEKRLEILKDPHIGAFSVICLVKCGLIYVAVMDLIMVNGDQNMVLELGLTFMLSRILSMITMKTFKLAKSDGMLSDEAKFANRRMLIIVVIELLIVGTACVCIDAISGIIVLGCAALVTAFYKKFTYSAFGGITGDTAGYYVVINEVVMATALAVLGIVK